jgi:hypothetical protein
LKSLVREEKGSGTIYVTAPRKLEKNQVGERSEPR